MKSRTTWATVSFWALLTALPLCHAEVDTPRIDLRQENQQRRIEQGVDSGRLTTREARPLENQQDRIQRLEDRAKEDGIVTRKEHARLRRQQNLASHNIYRKMHNFPRMHNLRRMHEHRRMHGLRRQ